MLYSALQWRLSRIKRFGQSSGKLLVISQKSLQELVFGGAAFFTSARVVAVVALPMRGLRTCAL
eukprot:7978469-Pyramimonas_sp.AAC.1